MPKLRLAVAAMAVALLGVSVQAAVIDTVSLQTPAPTSFVDSLGAAYSLTAYQPTGSGVFLPFMRIQREGDAQGYNSSLNNTPNGTMDLINLPGNSTSTLPLNYVVTADNKVYLTLDYNEQGAKDKTLLTLSELILVISSDANKTGPVGPGNNDPWSVQSIPFSAGDQIVYQMSTALDGNGNGYSIQLNADANPANGNGGSGGADLNVAIDLSGVQNLSQLLASGGKYLYVYSRFSDAGAGFEEWNAFNSVTNPSGGGGQVPEPASLAVLSTGALLLLRRRKSA